MTGLSASEVKRHVRHILAIAAKEQGRGPLPGAYVNVSHVTYENLAVAVVGPEDGLRHVPEPPHVRVFGLPVHASPLVGDYEVQVMDVAR